DEAVTPPSRPPAQPESAGGSEATPVRRLPGHTYEPRQGLDVGGFSTVMPRAPTWEIGGSLGEVRPSWQRIGFRSIERLDQQLVELLFAKAALYNYEGEPKQANQVLQQARALVESQDELAAKWLYSLIYSQGVTALRQGETENCIECRGES